MSKKDEALKLALEALQESWRTDKGDIAITALREALAEQPAQQEPFGYFKAEPFGWTDCAETDEGAVALYQHPPAQPQQEPDNSDDLTIAYMAGVQRGKDLAQRTWVGLTDDERVAALFDVEGKVLDYEDYAEAIEAKLKERNT